MSTTKPIIKASKKIIPLDIQHSDYVCVLPYPEGIILEFDLQVYPIKITQGFDYKEIPSIPEQQIIDLLQELDKLITQKPFLCNYSFLFLYSNNEFVLLDGRFQQTNHCDCTYKQLQDFIAGTNLKLQTPIWNGVYKYEKMFAFYEDIRVQKIR